MAPDNLDVLADEVGEEIGEFEYGLENESLPKPPTPQELRNAIVNEGMFIEYSFFCDSVRVTLHESCCMTHAA